jgi:hypothetical protein
MPSMKQAVKLVYNRRQYAQCIEIPPLFVGQKGLWAVKRLARAAHPIGLGGVFRPVDWIEVI